MTLKEYLKTLLQGAKTYVDEKVAEDISGKANIVYVDTKIEENKYNHPSSHPASIIATTDDKQFVSQSEKNN